MGGSNLKAVLNKARTIAKPKKEHAGKVNNFVITVNALLKKQKIKAHCVVGGSYAKGTMIGDSFDVDLFVRFDISYKNQDISTILKKAIAPLKPILVHGSRDYFQVRKSGLVFEIIPVLKIDHYKHAVNVTDMSPLHVDYAKSHYLRNASLAEEVRLAKQFSKAIGAYGAESYIRGFSGHVLDLLIIHYGSFEKLLMQAALWGDKVIIDIEKHLKDPIAELNESKTESPIIIVDPIQPDRNAAAAVSKEKFETLKASARHFLRDSSINFFKIKKLSKAILKKKSGKNLLFTISAIPLKGKDDVVGTKILKCHEYFLRVLKENGFSLIEAGWEYDRKKSTLYYILKKEKLSDSILLKGPPIRARSFCNDFRKKHKHIIQKDDHLYAREKRKFTEAKQLLKDAIKHSYVSERVKKISIS